MLNFAVDSASIVSSSCDTFYPVAGIHRWRNREKVIFLFFPPPRAVRFLPRQPAGSRSILLYLFFAPIFFHLDTSQAPHGLTPPPFSHFLCFMCPTLVPFFFWGWRRWIAAGPLGSHLFLRCSCLVELTPSLSFASPPPFFAHP